MNSFQSALSGGHRAERRWVDSQRAAGRSVAHGKKLLIRNHDKYKDHVPAPDALALLSIEIKERSLTFTSPEDYPYDTVFVDDLRGLGRESVSHFAYVYVSKPTGKWVWLSPIDRDESWHESKTFDRARQHELPILVAPKRFLRPASQLTALLYPHHLLDLVDGDTAAFFSGGGATEERERYVARTHPDFGGRDPKNPSQNR